MSTKGGGAKPLSAKKNVSFCMGEKCLEYAKKFTEIFAGVSAKTCK